MKYYGKIIWLFDCTFLYFSKIVGNCSRLTLYVLTFCLYLFIFWMLCMHMWFITSAKPHRLFIGAAGQKCSLWPKPFLVSYFDANSEQTFFFCQLHSELKFTLLIWFKFYTYILSKRSLYWIEPLFVLTIYHVSYIHTVALKPKCLSHTDWLLVKYVCSNNHFLGLQRTVLQERSFIVHFLLFCF